mmetsp:Transcript_23160/g.54942  ORF Transcript_23160/g.54942 Transcript_23160/m.54942 type:complete len:395 (-) Transcript_23160:110-1294(-)
MLFFGTKIPTSPDKHVLIIGGGMAGLSAITGLRQKDKDVKITLVDAKDYCEIFWSSYRSPFDEDVAKDSLVRLPQYCSANNVEFVQATVKTLTKSSCEALLMDPSGQTKTIDFDVCVVATGANSSWKGMGRDLPTTPDAAKAESRLVAMKQEGERLMNAKSVVVVGGGLIGTELAGDLAGYAKKAEKTPKITLVHSGEFLCNTHMSVAAGNAVQTQLEDLGVEIVLNEKAEETSSGKVTLTKSNKVIDAEVVIKTIGFVPVNDFIKDSFPDALDERGWIKTDEYFVVPGSDGKVFAYGDCSPTMPNAGNLYFRSCALLGHNVQVALTGSDVAMKPAAKLFVVVINTAGPQQGVFYMDNGFWGRRFLPWVKNKTMFFSSPRQMLGVKDEWKLSKA